MHRCASVCILSIANGGDKGSNMDKAKAKAIKAKAAMYRRCAQGKPVNCDRCIGCAAKTGFADYSAQDRLASADL